MVGRWLRARSPLLIAGFGVALFLVAAVHHGAEIAALDGVVGPLLAFAFDGLPALALVYAGSRLSALDLLPESRWRVLIWCVAGAAVVGGAMGLTFLVRAYEGRVVAEPLFPLLVATEAGAIAGVVAGYYHVRARVDAREARTASDALAFVNSLIRHDLRNDLNVIRGNADLLDADGDPETADRASVIAGKAEEALGRIETTGAVVRTLTGDPDLEPVDLAAVAEEMAARTEDAFGLTVSTDLPDRALVTANAGLRSVVDNLLENAVEHNDADDPRVGVTVTKDAGTVTLSVADNGPGIPDDLRDRLSDAPGEPAAGGGLVLVWTLVDGYGGTVAVADNEPRGSVVTVELPRADPG